MKKDVLILCQYFYPEYVSSATLPTEMAEDMVESGMNVDVICGYPLEYNKQDQVPKKEQYKGIKINRIKYVQLDKKKTINRLINYFSFLLSIFLRWPKMLRYQCIIVYSNPPLLPILPAVLNKLFRKKFIFVSYDIYPDLALLMNAIQENSMIHKLMNLTNRLVYSRASKVIALGEEMKAYMLKRELTKDQDKIEVIPNWYDRNKVDGAPTAILQLNRSSNFTVLYSGNMGTCQDMDTILECAKLLNIPEHAHISFVLTGHGNKVDEIKQRIVDEHIGNVKMFGFLLGEDYVNTLSSANCFIVSLERGVEGMSVPSKTYSYLAGGRPLLSIMSLDTDISRVITKYNAGYTFEQGQAQKMADKIIYLSQNVELCSLMGKNARRVFEENYERKICTTKYIQCVNSVVNR